MPAIPDHYTLLGLHPKASAEVVEAAWAALARKYRGNDAKLKRINEAGESLIKRRAAYDHSREEQLSSGTIVGEYRMLDKIAEGGFGETWKAEHIVNGKLVCIKYALQLDSADEALLVEESQSMWDLRHYSIPACRGLLRMPDGKLSLVMSYIPGPTLAQLITDKYTSGLDPEHVAWIAERILNALKYMHYHGVVHGDMKPQNVIVENEKHTVVIVDYGLAQVKPSHKDAAKGYTPYFCAPEQLDWKPVIPQTDLFGLGMTMIFALGGDVAKIRVPETTPPEMCKFIKRLIRRDPMQRPDVWSKEDLCETIKEVREKDFGRANSAMKPLVI